jgi:hypothetical protein
MQVLLPTDYLVVGFPPQTLWFPRDARIRSDDVLTLQPHPWPLAVGELYPRLF